MLAELEFQSKILPRQPDQASCHNVCQSARTGVAGADASLAQPSEVRLRPVAENLPGGVGIAGVALQEDCSQLRLGLTAAPHLIGMAQLHVGESGFHEAAREVAFAGARSVASTSVCPPVTPPSYFCRPSIAAQSGNAKTLPAPFEQLTMLPVMCYLLLTRR